MQLRREFNAIKLKDYAVQFVSISILFSALMLPVVGLADELQSSTGTPKSRSFQLVGPIDKPGERNAGVFVGINEFRIGGQELPNGKVASLSYAVHDAVELAWLFVVELELIPPRNCHLLISGEPSAQLVKDHLDELRRANVKIKSATRSNILASLRSQSELARSSTDMFFGSFSSHGFCAQMSKKKDVAFILPRDGIPDQLAQTAVDLDAVADILRTSKSGHKLLLVDACQERIDPQKRNVKPLMNAAFQKALATKTGLGWVASCSQGEASWEFPHLGGVGHGVFTYAVLESLRGRAQPDQGGLIRLGQVVDFVTAEVPSLVKRNRNVKQTPAWYGLAKARQLPLAVRSVDAAIIVRRLKALKVNRTFTASMQQQVIKFLTTLKPGFPKWDSLAAMTFEYSQGEISDKEYIAWLRSNFSLDPQTFSQHIDFQIGRKPPPQWIAVPAVSPSNDRIERRVSVEGDFVLVFTAEPLQFPQVRTNRVLTLTLGGSQPLSIVFKQDGGGAFAPSWIVNGKRISNNGRLATFRIERSNKRISIKCLQDAKTVTLDSTIDRLIASDQEINSIGLEITPSIRILDLRIAPVVQPTVFATLPKKLPLTVRNVEFGSHPKGWKKRPAIHNMSAVEQFDLKIDGNFTLEVTADMQQYPRAPEYISITLVGAGDGSDFPLILQQHGAFSGGRKWKTNLSNNEPCPVGPRKFTLTRQNAGMTLTVDQMFRNGGIIRDVEIAKFTLPGSIRAFNGLRIAVTPRAIVNHLVLR